MRCTTSRRVRFIEVDAFSRRPRDRHRYPAGVVVVRNQFLRLILCNCMIRISLIGCAIVVCMSTSSAQTATLKMRFVFDGIPPVQQNVAPRGGVPVASERLIVDPKNRGIKNVCVYAYDQLDGAPLNLGAGNSKKHILRIQNGRFDPHILICRVGDTLEVLNKEQVRHRIHLPFYNNPERRIVLAPGIGQAFTLNLMESSAIPVLETLYPWMESHVFVLTHPFAATSSTDGSLTIGDLPADSTIVFRCFHESVPRGFKGIQVNGEQVTWKRNRFEVSLKSGVNDLGEIRIPPDVFGRK